MNSKNRLFFIEASVFFLVVLFAILLSIQYKGVGFNAAAVVLLFVSVFLLLLTLGNLLQIKAFIEKDAKKIDRSFFLGIVSMLLAVLIVSFVFAPTSLVDKLVGLAVPPKVFPPMFAPRGGVFYNDLTVAVSTATEGASIHYTTDGSIPTESSSVYTEPLEINANKLIKAIAFKEGFRASDVAIANYILRVSIPTISPRSGVYPDIIFANISTKTQDAMIYYTTNGIIPTQQSLVYDGPILISNTTTIRAKAFKDGFSTINEVRSLYTIKAATPKFTPASRLLDAPIEVSIESATPNSNIYFTTDNSAPTKNSNLYTGPFILSKSSLVMARAYRDDISPSSLSSARYTFRAAAPVITPRGGAFSDPVTVTLQSNTPEAMIYYTLDGSIPSQNSLLYTAPFRVENKNTRVLARAYFGDFSPSIVSNAIFTISNAVQTQQVAAPIITPNGGTFTNSVTVSMSDATAGAQIRYTTDGSIPNLASAIYSTPIQITQSAIVKARAFKTGLIDSNTATASFTINTQGSGTVAAPSITPNGGSFTAPTVVTLDTSTPGTQIRYTTDGTEPSSSSSTYLHPLKLLQTTTLKVRAFRQGFTDSAVATANFNINLAQQIVGNVKITPVGGDYVIVNNDPVKASFTTSVTVKLETLTPGATILYTLDGSTPTQGAPLTHIYSGQISITDTTIIKAKAVKVGMTDSDITNGAFVDSTALQWAHGITPNSYGEQRTAIIMIRWVGSPEDKRSDAERGLVTNPRSFENWWTTISSGLVWYNNDIYGWYTVPGSPCTFNQALLDSFLQADGFDEKNYERIITYIGDSCAESTLRVNWPTGVVQKNFLASNIDATFGGDIHTEWIGSSVMEAVGCSQGLSGLCTYIGDEDYDIDARMSQFYPYPYVPRTVNVHAGERELIGWMPKERIQEVTQDGIYKISSISVKEPPQDGSKLALKIHAPSLGQGNNADYYIQYRTPINSDSWLSSHPEYTKGVHVYLIIPGQVVGDISTNKVFDLTAQTPFDSYDNSMSDGQTVYDDVNNLMITQLSHDSTSATIKIKFGQLPCVRFNLSLSGSEVKPSYLQNGQAGSELVWQLGSFINSDLKSCSPTTFSIKAILPPQLTAVVTPSTVTVPAGSWVDPATITVKSASNAQPGTYNFQIKIEDTQNPSRSVTISNLQYAVIGSGGDVQPPTIKFGKADEGYWYATVFGKITIPSTVLSNNQFGSVQKVELLVDNVVVESQVGHSAGDNSPYYNFQWDTTKTSNGRRVVTLKAYGVTGGVGQVSRTITVSNPTSSGPNLIVRGIGRLSKVNKGTPVTVGVMIMNNGNAVSSGARVRFFPNLANPPTFTTTSPILDQSVGALEPGAEGTDPQFFDFTFTPTSNGTVYVVVDNGNPGSSPETLNSIEDNTGSMPYDLAIPNFAAKSITLSNVPGKVGQLNGADVKVRIDPNSAANHLRVRFYPELTSPPTYTTPSPIPDQFIEGVTPSPTGSDYSLFFEFKPSSAGSKTAYAIVDNGDPGLIDESDDSLADNMKSLAYSVVP